MNLALYPAPFSGFYFLMIILGAQRYLLCITPLYNYFINGTVCPPCSTAHTLKI